eukprot:UN02440
MIFFSHLCCDAHHDEREIFCFILIYLFLPCFFS